MKDGFMPTAADDGSWSFENNIVQTIFMHLTDRVRRPPEVETWTQNTPPQPGRADQSHQIDPVLV